MIAIVLCAALLAGPPETNYASPDTSGTTAASVGNELALELADDFEALHERLSRFETLVSLRTLRPRDARGEPRPPAPNDWLSNEVVHVLTQGEICSMRIDRYEPGATAMTAESRRCLWDGHRWYEWAPAIQRIMVFARPRNEPGIDCLPLFDVRLAAPAVNGTSIIDLLRKWVTVSQREDEHRVFLTLAPGDDAPQRLELSIDRAPHVRILSLTFHLGALPAGTGDSSGVGRIQYAVQRWMEHDDMLFPLVAIRDGFMEQTNGITRRTRILMERSWLSTDPVVPPRAFEVPDIEAGWLVEDKVEGARYRVGSKSMSLRSVVYETKGSLSFPLPAPPEAYIIDASARRAAPASGESNPWPMGAIILGASTLAAALLASGVIILLSRRSGI
jgi:hypothetical protein